MTAAANPTTKPRILYLLWTFPQLSQTYIKNEIEALRDDYEIKVVGLTKPNLPYEKSHAFHTEKKFARILEEVREFNPQILHAHWLNMAPLLSRLADKTAVPFTIRAHSFDILGTDERYNPLDAWIRSLKFKPNFRGFAPEHVTKYLNKPECLGALVFPFARSRLEKSGVAADKLVDCFPVISYRRFHDRSPNGDGVMNLGACIPKKRMEDFVDLGKKVPQRHFSLYAIGYKSQVIVDYNAKQGNPIDIIPTLQPDAMPADYKKHQWLVYTADRAYNTVGWPMAVAEAQAAGVGVCLPNIRPDLKDYLGDAGFLYDSIDEVAEIIRNDVPEEIREKGFEQARKSDIEGHKHLLTQLWSSRVTH